MVRNIVPNTCMKHVRHNTVSDTNVGATKPSPDPNEISHDMRSPIDLIKILQPNSEFHYFLDKKAVEEIA